MSGWPMTIMWLGCVLVILVVFWLLASRIRPLLIGLLIDSRCKVSLSRFQIALWTLIVLSAYFACVIARLIAGSGDPLAVEIPEHLWWLMGISTVSLIGSPVIKSIKKSAVSTRSTVKSFSGSGELIGVLHVNSPATRQAGDKSVQCPAADWGDMFMGEEAGNYQIIDLGKVQMFLFTIVIAIAYLVTLLRLFWMVEMPDGLPAVSDSMVALLAISHGGYLSYKAAPHS